MLAEMRTPVRPSESWQTTALLADPNDAAFTQSGIDGVTVSVFDESVDPSENLWAATQPAVSAVFFNTLQTGSGWDLPSGFNFKHIVTPTDLNAAINGAHTYRVRYDVATVLHGARVIQAYFVVVA